MDIGEKILSIEVVLVPKGSAGPQSAAPRYKSAASSRLSVAENATVMFSSRTEAYITAGFPMTLYVIILKMATQRPAGSISMVTSSTLTPAVVWFRT
ncbi:MAG: hypothetical protein ACLT76_06350 [Clostridium fessum]